MTEKIKQIHEGTLEIVSREAHPLQGFNPKKMTPVTKIKIVGEEGDYYATEIFRDIPSEYNETNVRLSEYGKYKKNGGVIKDKLFFEGHVFPLVSKRKFRENKIIV